MANRTCMLEGCQKPHRARGYCSTHYNEFVLDKAKRHVKTACICVVCGTEFHASRKTGKLCSDACRGVAYQTVCKLPADHPVLLEARKRQAIQREAARAAAELRRVERLASWRTPRECAGCGCAFSPLLTPTQLTCSRRCSGRIARRRRRAREHNTLNDWRWSDFMRIAAKFSYCCAYCGEKPERLDPDHVVPLARGGADAVSNLLPACPNCNGQKRDLLLHEWEQWRAEHGQTPRTTRWDVSDRRFAHLTQALLISPAA